MIHPDSAIAKLFDSAVRNRISPAIAGAFGTSEFTRIHCAGTHDFKTSTPCTNKTVFDLASLTKILSTTLIAADAISRQQIYLYETPFTKWPNIRVIDLLTHTSGLPPTFLHAKPSFSRRNILDLLDSQFPNPKTETLYSDVGFIALGELLEARLHRRIDTLFAQISKAFFPTSNIQYYPRLPPGITTLPFAPTGYCSIRNRFLRGEVNDITAYLMEGAAPHAGLFGSIADVVIAAQALLSAVKLRRSQFENAIYRFAFASGIRGLGFDKAGKGGSTAGVLSPFAFGHLGFTGTSLWIDPLAAQGKGAFFVLLTNHLEAFSTKLDLLSLRQHFHRLASRAIALT